MQRSQKPLPFIELERFPKHAQRQITAHAASGGDFAHSSGGGGGGGGSDGRLKRTWTNVRSSIRGCHGIEIHGEYVPLFRITALAGRHNVEAVGASSAGVAGSGSLHDYRLSGPVADLGAGRPGSPDSVGGGSFKQGSSRGGESPAGAGNGAMGSSRALPPLPASGGSSAGVGGLPPLPGQLGSPVGGSSPFKPAEGGAAAAVQAEIRLVEEKKVLLDALMLGLEASAEAAVTAALGPQADEGSDAGGLSLEAKVELLEHFKGAAAEAIERVHRRANPGGGYVPPLPQKR